jgi:hypothetical protein
MLENAELSIGEAKNLENSSKLSKSSRDFDVRNLLIAGVRSRWSAAHLPHDLSVLAENLQNFMYLTQYSLEEIWLVLDSDTAQGFGTNVLNLSPFSSIVSSFLRQKREEIFKRLLSSNSKSKLFIASEVDAGDFPSDIALKIVRL